MINVKEGAFWQCSSLCGTLDIPDSVTELGDNAFAGCFGLDGDVIISQNVTSIGNRAFSGLSYVNGFFFRGNAPTVSAAQNWNRSFPEDKTLYYRAGTVGWTDSTAYNASRGTWNGYNLALWGSQSVQIRQATPQSVTLQVQNHKEAYVCAAIYKDGKLIKVVCKRVPVNAGEVTLALGMDELPEGAVIKAFVLAADGKTPLAKNAVWTVR